MYTNLPQQKTTSTTEYSHFDNYYKQQNSVGPSQYDAVYTFFLGRTKNNVQAAESLSASLLKLTYESGIDPMLVLEDFKKYNSNESFKIALIALFNSSRANTSKIGFTPSTVAPPLVSRNIRK
jgi:hypothetical protein